MEVNGRIALATLLSAVSLWILAFPRPAECQSNYSILTSFFPDGITLPQSGLILASDGNLYGTTEEGGGTNNGSVYMMTPSGNVTILYSFGSMIGDGAKPLPGLVVGQNGDFYGADIGALFSITPAGVFTVVHSLSTADGALCVATDGTIYGTTSDGGTASEGTVFSYSTTGVFTVLHSFDDKSVPNDGLQPQGGVIEGPDGNLYGTTIYGGSANEGTIYSITPAGVVTILHSFGDGSVTEDGQVPKGDLALGSDGAFYGTAYQGGVTTSSGTQGVVYKMTVTGGAAQVKTLHAFGDGTVTNDGALPFCTLVQGSNGDFYGTTISAGAAGNGTIFEITPSGVETTLYSFGTVASDGVAAQGQLALSEAGVLYGTCRQGGTLSDGIAFSYATGVNNLPAAPTPTISPNGGTFAASQTITVTDSLAGATIYYTTDGTVPTTSSTVYSGPITVSASETINAIAAGADYSNSGTATAVFYIGLPPPTFSPDGGASATPQTVTIADAYAGATIYYTTDGSTPTSASTQYAGPLTVSTTETINAIAEASGFGSSMVSSAAFQILIVPPPRITPIGGSYPLYVTVTMADNLDGANIYYTTDGSSPTAASKLYSGPFVVSASTSLNAFAAQIGYTSSSVVSTAYTITVPVATFNEGLQLISLPYTYNDLTLDDLFGYTGVELAVWNPAANTYALTPTAPADGIVAGQGYWVRFPNKITIMAQGAPASTNTPFVIHLQKGWNMVGDPFPSAVPINSLMFDDDTKDYAQAIATPNPLIQPNFYSYDSDGNQYEIAVEMAPQLGFWVCANRATDMEVPPPTSGQ